MEAVNMSQKQLGAALKCVWISHSREALLFSSIASWMQVSVLDFIRQYFKLPQSIKDASAFFSDTSAG